MLRRLSQFIATRLVRLFYSQIEVHGGERLCSDESAVYVLNHPNGILDPVVLTTVIKRPVTFWSKSTLIAVPFLGWIAATFGAVPVYRKADVGKHGGALDAADMAQRNESTFRHCQAILRKGGALALFPEGQTHSEPYLLPIRTGAARMVLRAANEAGWSQTIPIVPIGLWYENNTRFRTAVLVVVGEPIAINDYAALYLQDSREAVQALTKRIDAGLHGVVLEAENSQLVKSIPAVALWTAPEGVKPDLTMQHVWAARLLEAYREMQQRDPDLLGRIAEEAWSFASLLNSVGVSNPWQLEDPRVHWGQLAWNVLALSLLAIPACLGLVLSIVPYRMSGTLARTAWPDDRTQAGTAKLLGGTFLTVAMWASAATVIGILSGPLWGLVLAALALPCAYATMRWTEMARTVRDILRYIWLRERKAGLVAGLVARRHALARSIAEAVASLE